MDAVVVTRIMIIISILPLVQSDNYLVMVPPETGSQTVVLASAATALIERNHTVTLLVAEDFTENVRKRMHSDKFTTETFKSSVTTERFNTMEKNLTQFGFQGRNLEWVKLASTELPMLFYHQCEDLFSHQLLTDRLQGEKFDLVLAHAMLACPVLLAQYLHVQFVSIITAIPPTMLLRIFGNPVNPAYTPELMTGFSNRMTFLQKVKNTIFSGIQWTISGAIFDSYDDLKQKYNIKPEMSTFESISQAELSFVCSHFVLDFPRAYQPNVMSVGGLSASPPRPLPQVSVKYITIYCYYSYYFF